MSAGGEGTRGPSAARDGGSPANFSDWFIVRLRDRPVVALGVMLVVGGAVLLWHLSRLSTRLLESAALQGTQLYSHALAEFRTLYTSEVVSRLEGKAILVTHDYKSHAGAVPLPATLSLELGEAIGRKGTGLRVRLFSDHPFPWRRDEGGPRDEFEKAALAHLRASPDVPYYRFEEFAGRPSLRYATADLMRPACVSCHNSHPDSPKRDWKTGDVRGVLEVIRPLDPLVEETRTGLRETLFLMLGMAGVGLFVLALVTGRLRRTSAALTDHVRRLHESAESIRRINEELVVARDEALAASRAKSEFLSTMSHELRTPLNHILGYAGMLGEEARDRGQEGWAGGDLGKIETAGKGLLGVVERVLDLSDLEAGRVTLKAETVDVAAVVGEVVADVHGLAERNGNRIETRLGGGLGSLVSDRHRVRQVLLLVVENACKFTHQGEVVVEVERVARDGGELVALRVKDTGVGMSPEALRRVFESFSQGDSSSRRRHGGVGIGLAIARRLCDLLGGSIRAESVEGKGSAVTIELPAAGRPG